VNNVLTEEPLRNIDGILDYMGNISSEFFDDLERIATEERDGIKGRDNIRLELEVLKNCLEIVLPNVLPNLNASVIDIGGGNGFLLGHLKYENRVLCDSSFVKLQQVSPDILKIRADAEQMPIKSGMFDLALCTDIFEHVKDEKALSREITRLLKPGGILFLSVPWKQNLDVLKSPEYLAKYGEYPSGHCRSVNEETIDECFGDFEIMSATNLDVVRRFMEFEPYSIRLFLMRKKEHGRT
jgi:SAM-dependent methyltransferase